MCFIRRWLRSTYKNREEHLKHALEKTWQKDRHEERQLQEIERKVDIVTNQDQSELRRRYLRVLMESLNDPD
jgi:hypothetical protein